MNKKASGIMLVLFLVGSLSLVFDIQPARAEPGTIYIRADGSIEGTDKIISSDNVTYTFTDNIYDSIVVERDNIVVDGTGYTLRGNGSGTGISLSDRSNVTIKNTHITEFYCGISLALSSRNMLVYNTLTNNTYGIYLTGSSRNTLSGNNATNNRYSFEVNGLDFGDFNNYVDMSNTVDGKPIYYLVGVANAIFDAEINAGVVFLINCQNVTVKDLTLTKNGAGVFLWNTTNSKIENVTATRSIYGIYLQSSSNNTLFKNRCLDNSYGIRLYLKSNQNILSYNNATNNSYGIFIQNSNNNNLTSNTITDGSLSGIYLYDSSSNTLSGNVVSSSTYGIELWAYGSYGNILSGNVVSSSGVDGIVLNGAHNNTLSGNIVSSNGQYGITLMADNNIIYGNTIVNNSGYSWSSGIYIQFHYNNIISSNTIKDNTQGIFLYGSGKNNKLFHNNFINNTNQVYVSGEHSNIWDDGYPSGGNYWSNYVGADVKSGPNQDQLGSDGLGDTPYIIDVNNSDRYPLMHPWSSLPVHDINTGLGYATIQEAIDANETMDGHRIFVEKGTYYEHVATNKSLSLIGENKLETVIDGNGTGTVLSIWANNVEFSGFTVQNGAKPPQTNYAACIQITVLSNNTVIHGNILKNSAIGIDVEGYNSSITNNCMEDNFKGIDILFGLGNNTFTENTIANSIWYGIEIIYSLNNTIFHNNFVDNNQSTYSTGSVNAWDNGVEGNYWSDYTGVDKNHNGIGDSPYDVFSTTAPNQDRYPLMAPIKSFNAGTWNNKTYHVDIVSNSTITGFSFNATGKTITFNVEGQTGTTGFCRVAIPTSLLWCDNPDAWTVKVGDTLMGNRTVNLRVNYTYIYFSYMHSTHQVTITSTNAVPEFQPLFFLPLFVIAILLATLLAAFVLKRKRNVRTQ